MLIDFKNIETKIIPQFKGGNKNAALTMFSDDDTKIMFGVLESGASIGLHKHQGSCEIIYILEGNGKILYNGEYKTLSAGLCHYCPEGQEHSLINDSDKDLKFFAVVPNVK